jgi:hypothetical protein
MDNEEKKVKETFEAYKKGGYQGLKELLHKRNEEVLKESEEKPTETVEKP